MPIQLLPDDVISQIAAGEVVERPSSVVKELIENAIDAGAVNIRVEISEGGRKLIKVSDDGSGIASEDIELLVRRHATSKLRTADDLYHIATLGFRGEAISSIVSVSRASILTRHRDEAVGTNVRIDAAQIKSVKPAGAPAGTVFSVENLFYNIPARLKFLKSDTTERRQISQVVMRYAMAYPDIRFLLIQDGREAFRSNGTGQLSDVIVQVFGLATFKQMVEISAEEPIRGTTDAIHVYGFTSEPELSRKDRTRIILFLNGRAIQDNNLAYAITQAYHKLLDRGEYPYSVVMIQVPPFFVDVNVHPTKAEVRFQDANVVFSAVQRAVRTALIRPERTHETPNFEDRLPRGGQWKRTITEDETRQMTMGWNVDSTQSGDHQATGTPRSADRAISAPERPRTLPPLRVVGQVGAAYIVTEGPAGMYLIDQHTAHQRVLFDSNFEHFQRDELVDTITIDGVTIDVSVEIAGWISANGELLEKLGFTLELFGTTTYLIRTLPVILRHYAPDDITQEILKNVSQYDGDAVEGLLRELSRLGAYKSGQILSIHEMQELARQLERCTSPQVSPFGQPTLIHMSADHLQREFSKSPRVDD